MTTPAWFAPDWRARYAALLRQMLELEALALAHGRVIRPRERR